ncbi:STN domain-containing protein [Aureispira anguillae]|uniref:STN domain-containing protein n=1 Tax=Aureispira anguillae TaxID=2864201 RepID=A0A915YC42_9BACT|nr:STN domain-containing protein [Aureispira anguillae]BDS10350.1 STN domain-containing protein [Aureispira anguillae]
MINKINIIILLFLLSFGKLYAQQVEVHFSEISLKEVLDEISANYNLQFSYSNNYLKLDRKISFHSEGKTLEATLDQLFSENNIAYATIGSQLVLKPSKAKDRKRKERKKRKKKREEKREEQSKRTLERGTLFDFDIHSELIGSTEALVEPEEKIERSFITINEIEPLVPESITGKVRYEDALTSERTPYVSSGAKKNKTSVGQFSILPFLATNAKYRSRYNVLSLNFFWGVNGGVNGLEVGIVGNTITRNVRGVQLSNLFNTVKGNLFGLQVSGMLNLTKGKVMGIQLAGIFNLGSNIFGTQVGGLANIARNLHGMQLSSLSNLATDVYGFQVSGLFNFANGKLFGSQIGGLGNIAWGGKSAVQFAGGFNMSAKAQFQIASLFNMAQNIEGAQLGTVNIARKVKGMQFGVVNTTRKLIGGQVGIINVAKKAEGAMIGLINVVDTIKGAPLGIINIVKKNGYNRFELSGSEAMYINIGAKFGPRHYYHIIQGGWRINSDNTYSWSLGLGVGTLFDLSENIHLNIELVCSHVNEAVFWLTKLNLLNQFKLTMDVKLTEKVSFFWGPTFNAQVSNLYDTNKQVYGSSIMPYTLFDQTNKGTNLKMWIGGVIGLRF